MYDIFKLLTSSAFGILMMGIGLTYLLVPYDTLKKRMPKLKSPKVIKIAGVILVLLGVMMIILGIQNVV